MAKLEYLVRESFKILVEDLPKVVALAMACAIIFNHTGDVSVNDFFCEVSRILRVKGSAPMLPVYLVSQILWDFHHLGSLCCSYGREVVRRNGYRYREEEYRLVS